MESNTHTIIISTPEDLLPLITEAIRAAGGMKIIDDGGTSGKKLLAPEAVEREFGIHRKTLAYWRSESIR